MKWNKFRLHINAEAEEVAIGILVELGIDGVQVEDGTDAQTVCLDFYMEEMQDCRLVLAALQEGLLALAAHMDVGACTIEESQTEEKDWIDNWKQYFHGLRLDDVSIVPSWEEVQEKPEGLVIYMDPGTAFGTGGHETTQLCMRQIHKYISAGTRMLDVGFGSGILGILALKCGASHVTGTDIEACAVSAANANMERNQVAASCYEWILGNLIDDKAVQEQIGYEAYDVVTANILPDVLLPLTPVVVPHLKQGGIYITSGIIDEKEDVVKRAIETSGLAILEVTHQGEWISITAQKN